MLNRHNPEKVARSIDLIDEITLDPITRAETRVAIPSMSAAKGMALRLASKGDILKCGNCRDIFFCPLYQIQCWARCIQIVLIQAYRRRKMVIGKEGECQSISLSLETL